MMSKDKDRSDEKEVITEDIIDCWRNNYNSISCEMLHGSCKNLYKCQILDNNYKNNYDVSI